MNLRCYIASSICSLFCDLFTSVALDNADSKLTFLLRVGDTEYFNYEDYISYQKDKTLRTVLVSDLTVRLFLFVCIIYVLLKERAVEEIFLEPMKIRIIF